MYDLKHTLYTIISFVLTGGLLFVFSRKVKEDNSKNLILKISAILTVILHYSVLYVDFFTTGTATVDNTMLLPVYPCNIAMWLLLIVALIKNKQSKVAVVLMEITFYLGVIGGGIGLIFNENYMNNPSFADWNIFKGLLSHSTLIFGSLWILVGGYIKIGVKNMVSVVIGLVGLLADGLLIIGLFKLCGLQPPNCMFLLENPFPQIKFFNPFLLGIVAIILIFLFTALYEQIAYKKEDRWYSKLKRTKEKKDEGILN